MTTWCAKHSPLGLDDSCPEGGTRGAHQNIYQQVSFSNLRHSSGRGEGVRSTLLPTWWPGSRKWWKTKKSEIAGIHPVVSRIINDHSLWSLMIPNAWNHPRWILGPSYSAVFNIDQKFFVVSWVAPTGWLPSEKSSNMMTTSIPFDFGILIIPTDSW